MILVELVSGLGFPLLVFVLFFLFQTALHYGTYLLTYIFWNEVENNIEKVQLFISNDSSFSLGHIFVLFD